MSRHLTSKPWWGLDTMRERIAALRAEIEPVVEAHRRADLEQRAGISHEKAIPPWKGPRNHGYQHKVKKTK